ncbi:hypothetical protein EN833_35230 [Mesorhizobium sp. M4B.F.Ca.ET.190.01.1.1]|nr:hypothetical protein EN833_35230 [Mesorhizobium sp. M4B.F.Ca.ET.190.01.1.1]
MTGYEKIAAESFPSLVFAFRRIPLDDRDVDLGLRGEPIVVGLSPRTKPRMRGAGEQGHRKPTAQKAGNWV